MWRHKGSGADSDDTHVDINCSLTKMTPKFPGSTQIWTHSYQPTTTSDPTEDQISDPVKAKNLRPMLRPLRTQPAQYAVSIAFA